MIPWERGIWRQIALEPDIGACSPSQERPPERLQPRDIGDPTKAELLQSLTEQFSRLADACLEAALADVPPAGTRFDYVFNASLTW